MTAVRAALAATEAAGIEAVSVNAAAYSDGLIKVTVQEGDFTDPARAERAFRVFGGQRDEGRPVSCPPHGDFVSIRSEITGQQLELYVKAPEGSA